MILGRIDFLSKEPASGQSINGLKDDRPANSYWASLEQPALQFRDLPYDKSEVGRGGGVRQEQHQEDALPISKSDKQAGQDSHECGLRAHKNAERFEAARRQKFREDCRNPGDCA